MTCDKTASFSSSLTSPAIMRVHSKRAVCLSEQKGTVILAEFQLRNDYAKSRYSSYLYEQMVGFHTCVIYGIVDRGTGLIIPAHKKRLHPEHILDML